MKQLNWYQIFGQQIPDGRTITPTDDIQIWLHCANIWNKAYTTLAEVLADTTTLAKLIASNNAIDYLVRSTTWAGTNLVPIMTDNTHPSGRCIQSGVMSGSYAYFAFDGDDSTYFATNAAISNAYVGYTFPEAQTIRRAKIFIQTNATSVSNYTFKIQGSNDGFSSDVHDLTTAFTISLANQGKMWIEKTLDSSNSYTSYRIICPTLEASRRMIILTMQFYPKVAITENSNAMTYIGQSNYAANTLLADATWREAICESDLFASVLNVTVPVMTSNNTPSGQCSATTVRESPHAPFKAFDSDNSTYWISLDNNPSNQRVNYQFDRSVKIFVATVRPVYRAYSSHLMMKNFKIQRKNSGSYLDMATGQFSDMSAQENQDAKFILSNTGLDTEYCLLIVDSYDSGFSAVSEVQFYGREDV
jgi:hypothetical protein